MSAITYLITDIQSTDTAVLTAPAADCYAKLPTSCNINQSCHKIRRRPTIVVLAGVLFHTTFKFTKWKHNS